MAAPCVDNELLTLAICKPAIRRSACIGDLLFGFGGNRESPPNRLVYIAEVSEVLEDGEYYRHPAFRGRTDCIYRSDQSGKLVLRANARRHHLANHSKKDIGCFPFYTNAVALICDDFRYFGASGTDKWKQRSPELAKIVRQMQQGHRRNHSTVVRRELRSLKKRVWRQFSTPVIGTPLLQNNARKPALCLLSK